MKKAFAEGYKSLFSFPVEKHRIPTLEERRMNNYRAVRRRWEKVGQTITNACGDYEKLITKSSGSRKH